MTYLVLDGTLIECGRVAGAWESGNWCLAQIHKDFGGNVQFLAAPYSSPLWASDVDPVSTRGTARR